jgi:hypothetical protein
VATAEVDGAKFESPEYAALIEYVPAVSAAVLSCAEPSLRVAAPSDALESRKLIVPVGVAVPLAGATLAVNVTLLPATIWVDDAESEVFVFTFAGAETVTAITPEVDAAKFESPE